MAIPLRRFLKLLLALAVIALGSPSIHAAAAMHRPAGAAMPCHMQAPHAAKPASPRPDCTGLACCTAAAVLQARQASGRPVRQVRAVAYWTAAATLAGTVRAPEPLPPRTA